MAQEEQNQRYSNSSSGGGGGGASVSGGGGGGRFSKKLKQKKIPQRGLGVAQLEKIRIEEQQRKDPSAIHSPPESSSYISMPLPNYLHNQSSSLVPSPPPLPPPPLTDLSLPNSLLRPTLPVPKVDILHSNTVPLANLTNGGAYDLGWPPIPGHGNVPRLWNLEYNLEGEISKVDPGLLFRSNLPYDSNPIWSHPNVMQRNQQYQQQPCSSMVNVSSATSSSSVPSFQMEPPSNQSYYGNYTPNWPEEEKIVGMKRPYPFSLDNPPGLSFHCKIPSFAGLISRSDESASSANGVTHNFDPNSVVFREAPSCSTSIAEPYSKKSIKGNGVFNGDFLSLAPPPSTTTPPQHQKRFEFKHKSAYPNFQLEFESLPYQGNTGENPIIRQETNGLIQQQQQQQQQQQPQQQPFFSFFPPAKAQNGQSKTTTNNCNGAGENVDLNLKL